MKIKDKFAASLRRWASKLSPERTHLPKGTGLYLPSPFGVSFYRVLQPSMEYRIPRFEEVQAKANVTKHSGLFDAYELMCEKYKIRIVNSLISKIWEYGAVEFTEERDPNTNELRIRGTLYIGIRKDNQV